MAKRRIHIKGSGGGTRGSFHPRIYTHLADTYDVVGFDGTSISAVNGLAVSTRREKELELIWRAIDKQSAFMEGTALNPFDGMHNLNPLRDLLQDQVERWGKPDMPFGVGVFWWERTKRIHTIERCDGVPAVRMLDNIIASATILGWHDTFEINGELAGDGGHHSPIPLRRWTKAFRDSIDEVHVPLCRPVFQGLAPIARRKVNNPWEMMMRWADYMTQRAIEQDLRALRRRSRKYGIPVYYYAPRDWDSMIPTFEKNSEQLRANISHAIEHGEWMVANRVRL